MDMREYQESALRTSPHPERGSTDGRQRMLLLGALGLCSEAGEVAEIIKKHVFHGHPFDATMYDRLLAETGDCLWYLNFIASQLSSTLEDVAKANIEKLAKRYPEHKFTTERSLHREGGDI